MQKEEIPDLTVEDLARIALYAIAMTTGATPEVDLAFGHVRGTYMPYIKLGRTLEHRALLPFSESEWEAINDPEALWSEIKRLLNVTEIVPRRITVTREALSRFLDERDGLTLGLSRTLCFGTALKTYGL